MPINEVCSDHVKRASGMPAMEKRRNEYHVSKIVSAETIFLRKLLFFEFGNFLTLKNCGG